MDSCGEAAAVRPGAAGMPPGVAGGPAESPGQATPWSVLDAPARAELTRRRLLQLMTLAAVAGLPRLGGIAPAGAGRGDPLTAATYEGLVGERFAIAGSGIPSVSARLVEVRSQASAAAARSAGGQEAFSLLLHGPRSPRLDQGVYELRHPSVRAMPLLVVPSGTGRRGQDYSVVINRTGARGA